MNSALELAGYIAGKYKKLYGTEIDQLKALKLLYFAQRESLVRDDSLLFAEPIFAFQHGPVVKEVHRAFQRNGGAPNAMGTSITDRVRDILDAVLRTYAEKSSWSLSRLTHAEYSRLSARRRKNSGGGERLMTIDDMRVDARRIRERRALRAGLRFRRIFNSDLQMFKYHLPDEASKWLFEMQKKLMLLGGMRYLLPVVEAVRKTKLN